MNKQFEQVFIHSEKDLPKEDGNYKCHFSDGSFKENFEFKSRYSQWWLNEVDWYLLPVDSVPSEEKKTDDRPIAYEWWHPQTGHCYVDYVEQPQIGSEKDGYVKKPLFYKS